MAEFPTTKGRVTGSRYLSLPDGHRTTLVVGMSDMLNYASLFASEERRARLDALLRFENPYESDALRQLFDGYMNADTSRQKFLTAGCFVSALDERCGPEK
jgi:hypothetical protein